MIYFVLLGKLGDLILFSRLSWQYPKIIKIITRPVFINLCKSYGNFLEVISSENMLNLLTSSDVVIDLHNLSETDDIYRKNIATLSPKLCATIERSDYLGFTANKNIVKRNHQNVSLIDYWSNLINLFYPNDKIIVDQNSLKKFRVEHNKFKDQIDILLSLQSSTLNKMFDIEATKYLISKILLVSNLYNKSLVILTGPGDIMVKKMMKECLDGFHENVLLINDLDNLFNVISNSSFVISVDNGIKHIAGLFGKKTIAIYGPTAHNICGSNDSEILVTSHINCAPCGQINYCPLFSKKKCLSFKETDVVIQKLIMYLEGNI